MSEPSGLPVHRNVLTSSGSCWSANGPRAHEDAIGPPTPRPNEAAPRSAPRRTSRSRRHDASRRPGTLLLPRDAPGPRAVAGAHHARASRPPPSSPTTNPPTTGARETIHDRRRPRKARQANAKTAPRSVRLVVEVAGVLLGVDAEHAVAIGEVGLGPLGEGDKVFEGLLHARRRVRSDGAFRAPPQETASVHGTYQSGDVHARS